MKYRVSWCIDNNIDSRDFDDPNEAEEFYELKSQQAAEFDHNTDTEESTVGILEY